MVVVVKYGRVNVFFVNKKDRKTERVLNQK